MASSSQATKLMKRECKVIELWPKNGAGTALHLLGEWYRCAGRRTLLEDAIELRQLCLFAARTAGLSAVGDLFHQSSPAGVTGTILLSESHLAIHTWSEERAATLDIFVGAHTPSNRMKARAVYAYLRAGLMPDKENFLQVNGSGPADRAGPH